MYIIIGLIVFIAVILVVVFVVIRPAQQRFGQDISPEEETEQQQV